MEKQSFFERQAEVRRRMIAQQSASKARIEYKDTLDRLQYEHPEAWLEIMKVIPRITDLAAYFACEATEESVAAEMKLLEHYANARLAIALNTPPNPVIIPAQSPPDQ